MLDSADIEGRPCLDCGDRCKGYVLHPWKYVHVVLCKSEKSVQFLSCACLVAPGPTV